MKKYPFLIEVKISTLTNAETWEEADKIAKEFSDRINNYAKKETTVTPILSQEEAEIVGKNLSSLKNP